MVDIFTFIFWSAFEETGEKTKGASFIKDKLWTNQHLDAHRKKGRKTRRVLNMEAARGGETDETVST